MRPELYFFFTPVNKIKGVGPKTYEAFKRLGLNTVLDLLLYRPYEVVDRRLRNNWHGMHKGQPITIRTKVIELHIPVRAGQPARIICEDCHLLYFNRKALPHLKAGDDIALTGNINGWYNGVVEIAHPETVLPGHRLAEIAVIQPIYSSTYGTTSRYISNAIKQALNLMPILNEWIPAQYLNKYNLPSYNESINSIHTPRALDDIADHSRYITRLAFDEMLAIQMVLQNTRKNRQVARPPHVFNNFLVDQLNKLLPFSLTTDQQKVIAEITKDQQQAYRMIRLLQADVGAGKTLVALYAMLNMVEANKQAILIAPTELLAVQHWRTLSEYTEKLGIQCQLLVSKLKAAEKRIVKENISNGSAQIIIGTHALLQESVTFHALGLVVIDEQHRFGVLQRDMLINKNPHADLLMMSATPIPRTLAMVMHGDLHVSIMQQKPANRLPITTSMLHINKEYEVLAALERNQKAGHKAYWVCPLIEESEVLDLSHVTARYELLNQHFRGKVGLVHGQLPADIRQETMQDFQNGRYDILLATSVIEVGVDVKDATVMVIENAERFGMAQLHQLRGRVGRSALASYCLLLYSDKTSKTGFQRLTALRECQDGFLLAEQDMKIRGAGEYLGTKQSGDTEYKFFSCDMHTDMLEDIFALAAEYVNHPTPASKVLYDMYSNYIQQKA